MNRSAAVPGGSAAACGWFGRVRICLCAAVGLRHTRAPSQQFAELFRRQPSGFGDASHGDGVDGIVARDHEPNLPLLMMMWPLSRAMW